MNREAYMHDVDLGAPLDPEEIGKIVNNEKHSEVLRAVLQLIRNSAMQNVPAAHDMIAAGRIDCGHLNLGGHAALSELFWNVVTAKMATAYAAEDGAGERPA